MRYSLIVFLIFLMPLQKGFAQEDKLLKAEFETNVNQPVKVRQLGEGHYFFDFGKAWFGTLLLKAQTAQNDSLVIHLGEKLASSGNIDRNPGGTIRYQRIVLPALKSGKKTRIHLPPNQRNSNPPAIILPDSFGVVMPFRYCEIENLKIPVENLRIFQKAFHYKFNDQASGFSSSDKVLNQIWDLCKHTIEATSFTGYYVDGDRERIPYEADACINQLSHYAVDNVYSLARRTNEYFISHPTWPTEWILHTAKMFYYDYLYTGDKQSIKKYYDRLKDKTLIELEQADGLISTQSPNLTDGLILRMGFSNPKQRINDIVDWPEPERDGYEMQKVNTVVNAFYYDNLRYMSLIAEALGKNDDAAFYRDKARQVKAAINKNLFDSSRGIYIDGEGSQHASLHANMFPLAFGLVPEENVVSVVKFIKSKGMACSVYGAQYLLEGLYNNNEAAYAKHLITDTSSLRTWWNMIKVGSTMTLEAWDQKYKPNLDWNHAWGTAPANIITRNMWGITPKTPGFGTAEIHPKLDGLENSEIKVPTIKGSIYAKFKQESKSQQVYEITLPKSVIGEFILPEEFKSVEVNGVVVENKNTAILQSGKNQIEIIL